MDYWIEDWEGTIPPSLHGTFLTVGPGKYERGGVPIKCWLEGDGAMTAVTFHEGRVHVKARFVETKAYLEEKIENCFLYRGQFGTMKTGHRNVRRFASNITMASERFRFPPINAFDMNFKNPSNTKPLYWGNRLLSTFETALPYELDPHTLQTKGEFTFGGLLRSGEAITSADPVVDAVLQRKSGHAFTAHARVDRATNRLVGWSWKTLLPQNWGLGFLSQLLSKKRGGAGLEVTFYEWNEEFDTAFPPVTIHVPDCPSPPHDWMITRNYYVWMQSAFTLNLLPCILGMKGPGECMVPVKGEEARSVVHLIPRPGGKAVGQPPMTIEVDPYFMTHWSHGHDVMGKQEGGEEGKEGEAERVIGYAAGWDKSLFEPANSDGHMFGHTYKGAPDFSRLPLIRYYRLDVDLKEKRASFEAVGPLNQTFLDFPKVHPRYETRGEPGHVWAMACNDRGMSSPPQGYVHLDLKTGQVDSWHAPSCAAAATVAAAAAAAAYGGERQGNTEMIRMEAEDKSKHIVVGEGVLAPRILEGGREGGQKQEEEELNCYWMGIEFDALTGRRSLCVFDAARIKKGPLCKLHLKHRLPWGIHSEWVEGLEIAEPDVVAVKEVEEEEEEEGGLLEKA
ncbi:hypothetical protein VYU27_004898 [Nannochloropsis oceanica]